MNLLYSSHSHIYNYNYNLQILDTLDLFNQYSDISFFHIKNDSLWIVNDGDLFFKKGADEDLKVYSNTHISALSTHQNEILLGSSNGLTFVNMTSYFLGG